MEAKEKAMDNVFWICFHSIMLLPLTVISFWVEEIAGDGKDIRNNHKNLDGNKDHSIGETIMTLIIMLVVVLAFFYLILQVVLKRPTVSAWFVGIYGVVYVYIAIKQVIKIIFIPEDSAFSNSDIKGFVYIYIMWWFMVAVMSSSQSVVDILNRIPPNYVDVANLGMLLLWYYFNILFALGSVYIFLYYLWRLAEKLANKYQVVWQKIKGFIEIICNYLQKEEKFVGLRSYKLWKKDNRKRIIYNIFMSIPLVLFDIWNVVCLLTKIFIRMTFAFTVVLIVDPIRLLYKYIPKVWYRHNNNEWMYVLAQIAGLCSYAIVFLIVQYGEYGELTKGIYEFIGTIILIPYFVTKIVGVKKNKNVKKSEASIEVEEKPVIPGNMTYNENGEGVIDGKTIRQLEYEVMQYSANNPQTIKLTNDKELGKELRRIDYNSFRKRISKFFENNIEIIVGMFISVCLISIYFIFRSADVVHNISMIGSIIGAEGAMLSVLLSISFMKRSNKKALDASVLPYLTIEKEKFPAENAYAFEYIKDTDAKRNFSIWRTFDFDTIRDNKIKLVRNGIAYLHIKNIGIGPAIHLKMEVENFSSIFLPIDYLRTNDEMNLILNFNNPNQSCKTDIVFEYETIRGERHTQRFHANITWHLDRTNFTLFR